MRRVQLGRTGLDVSPICFGTWQLGGDWGEIDRDEAKAAIRRALDLGINFFDTAQAYGFGKSEALLGRALRQELKRDRDSLVIATKGGINPRSARPRDSAKSRSRSTAWRLRWKFSPLKRSLPLRQSSSGSSVSASKRPLRRPWASGP